MTKLAMPKIDRKLIAKKTEIIAGLKKIIRTENILDHEDEIRPFETDALSAYKQKPLVVVFPENTKEVSKVLAYCNQHRIKVVPRGSGTGLSGGALPLADSLLLCLGKFNKIIMSDEDQKKPKIPHRMSRIAWPNAKYGVCLAITIIIVVLLIFYRDLIF